ncbi:hypothetical protein GQ53DRAFT_743651 [Thozetella sp. PMI_491]|nr:hypothetical protein GQ53DRAFT_743651 [Thozetella sp. PMI_491]
MAAMLRTLSGVRWALVDAPRTLRPVPRLSQPLARALGYRSRQRRHRRKYRGSGELLVALVRHAGECHSLGPQRVVDVRLSGAARHPISL